jgi:hypothetical protein
MIGLRRLLSAVAVADVYASGAGIVDMQLVAAFWLFSDLALMLALSSIGLFSIAVSLGRG